jgi:hypothetical protein
MLDQEPRGAAVAGQGRDVGSERESQPLAA